eukprot:NODE_186_length_13589_cov_0.385545.p14 type:complete len:106 gc:universal NODE_186_length_13589_cov_0.385545:3741-4058(+)
MSRQCHDCSMIFVLMIFSKLHSIQHESSIGKSCGLKYGKYKCKDSVCNKMSRCEVFIGNKVHGCQAKFSGARMCHFDTAHCPQHFITCGNWERLTKCESNGRCHF